ncbi:MAG: hypothetical protein KBT69_14085 [Oceanihabitans sp.]|nr:hypothetical protein [Oceanihabitans sp.]
MKTLWIALFTLASFFSIQDKTTVTAIFDGVENEAYYFSDDADVTHVFDTMSEEAIKKFDLSNEKYSGQTFRITYTTETIMDEMENNMEVLTIVDLEILSE